MRKKLILIIISLFMLFYVTGCSADKDEVEGNTGVSEDEEQAGLNLKNSGVIIDTVVDVFKDSSIQSDRVTQAIFNQPAEILEEEENWTKVKVVDGYTGWIKSKYIDGDISSLNVKGCKYRVVVTSKNSKVLSEAKYGAVLREVVMGTEFYPVNSVDGWYQVILPQNKKGWLNESGTIQIPIKNHIMKTTADDFVATAKKFNGSTYLSGGVSAWGGIDSSGLTFISSRINGVDLPRDIGQQYKSGKAVDKSGSFIPGDLIFFSSNEDLKDISIVGIYIGDNQFLHASKSKGTVTTGLITDSFFQRRLIGVRRIF